jgi:hypothetical protein
MLEMTASRFMIARLFASALIAVAVGAMMARDKFSHILSTRF